MTDAAASNAPEWTVSELSGALKRTLEDAFGHVRLRGEISGYRGPPASGHAYFCLKDRDARLDAVVWRTAFARLRFKPQEGLEVVAVGRITTFPGKSTYQMVVESLEPAGVGALMALLDERRRRLAAEGLFAAERKRRIPFLPTTIAVVTSPTGSVIHDILHRLADRFPRHVLVWPVRVQGETCADEVAAAIQGINALRPEDGFPIPEIIIVARGGGSLEDLWGFNEENVVRAAAASAIPLIAAIGHETDWTLVDHVADLRAPTPTAAAEMAVPVRAELSAQVGGLARRSSEASLRVVALRRTELRGVLRGLPSGEKLLSPGRQRLDLASARLAPALLANARLHETRLRTSGDALAQHTPRIELGRARERLDAAAERLRAGRDGTIRAERLRLGRCREQVAETAARGERAWAGAVQRQAARVAAAGSLLASLGYRSVLARGFAVVRSGDGHPISRAGTLAAGQAVELEFADGRRRAQIDGKARRRVEPLAQIGLFDQ